jgi:hypothetical protein
MEPSCGARLFLSLVGRVGDLHATKQGISARKRPDARAVLATSLLRRTIAQGEGVHEGREAAGALDPAVSRKTLTIFVVGWRGMVRVFRVLAITTFLLGTLVHTLRLILGAEQLSATILTPAADGVFGLLMVVAAVAGWSSYRRFKGGRGGRVALIFMLVLITLSIPIHLRSVIVWSTHYITLFPPAYSIVEIPMFLGLAYVVRRLRFE